MFDLKSIPDDALYGEIFRRLKCAKLPQKRIVLFGPPGCGKGTQGQKLEDELCGCHIATGDLLRQEIRDKSDLGLKAQDIMNRGDLVPDDLVIEIIKNAIHKDECKKGVIFDGFPRTVSQAEKLDKMLEAENKQVDKVFNFEIDEETLVDRLGGRRVHEKSGRSYHLKYAPPKVEGKDDLTGEPLIQRKDDNTDTIKKRFENYRNITAPLTAYYAKKGNLVNLNAKQSIDAVWKEISGNIFI